MEMMEWSVGDGASPWSLAMKRSSEAISLVLIGAAMTLTGCYKEEEQDPNAVQAGSGGSYVGHSGVHFRSPSRPGGVVVIPSTAGRAVSASPGVSAPSFGGFGSTGHAAAAAGIGG
jgi:hypothetical protein